MKYFWSIAFIAAGTIILGNSIGWWDASWTELVRFWPLILIFLGLDIVTTGQKLQPLVMIIALVAAGLFVYDAGFSPNPVIKRSEKGSDSIKTTDLNIDMPSDTKEATLVVKTWAMNFNIAGNTQKFIAGSYRSSIMEAEVDSKTEEGTIKTEITTKAKRGRWFFSSGIKNEMNLALNNQVPVNIFAEGGASTLNFDLTEYLLKKLEIKAGASTIDVKLGEKTLSDSEILIEAGAATIDVKVPESYGVKIISESGLTTNDFNGFSKKDDGYTSDGYDKTTKRITLRFKSGASTITVNRY